MEERRGEQWNKRERRSKEVEADTRARDLHYHASEFSHHFYAPIAVFRVRIHLAPPASSSTENQLQPKLVDDKGKANFAISFFSLHANISYIFIFHFLIISTQRKRTSDLTFIKTRNINLVLRPQIFIFSFLNFFYLDSHFISFLEKRPSFEGQSIYFYIPIYLHKRRVERDRRISFLQISALVPCISIYSRTALNLFRYCKFPLSNARLWLIN